MKKVDSIEQAKKITYASDKLDSLKRELIFAHSSKGGSFKGVLIEISRNSALKEKVREAIIEFYEDKIEKQGKVLHNLTDGSHD